MPGGTVSRLWTPDNGTSSGGVHKLPYELLHEIFRLRLSSLDVAACESQPSCHKDLTLVCTFRRDIALSLLLPFSEIDIHLAHPTKRNKRNLKTTKDALRAYLDRSKDASIFLTVHIASPDYAYNRHYDQSGVNTDAWAIAMSQKARCRSITFHAPSAKDLALVLPLHGSFKCLQKIHFHLRTSGLYLHAEFPRVFDGMRSTMPEMHFQIGSYGEASFFDGNVGSVWHPGPERAALAQDYRVIQAIHNCTHVWSVSFGLQFDVLGDRNPWTVRQLPRFLSQYPARIMIKDMLLRGSWGDNTLCRFPELPITGLTLDEFQSFTVQTLSMLFRSCPLLTELRIIGGSTARVALQILADDTRAVLQHLERLEVRHSGFAKRYKSAALADLLDRRPTLSVEFDFSSLVLSDMGNSGARALKARYPSRFICS